MTGRSALTACAVLGLALVCRGEGPPDRDPPPVDSGGGLSLAPTVSDSPRDRASRAAVTLALAKLAEWQNEEADGSMPPAGGREFAPDATTALAALAWMAAGSTPGRGPYGSELSRALDYLVEHTDLDPNSPTYGYVHNQRDGISKTHGHGFATLAMAQAFALSPKSARGRRLQKALRAAVACIENSQGAEGGWEYEPKRLVNHEGSVTICLVQALRGAKDAGLAVDSKVIARALDYVRRSQKDDGSFRYAIGNDRSSVALTAAAIATLNAGGEYSGPAVLSGFDWLSRELAARAVDDAWVAGDRPSSHFPHYERFYLAQALWQHTDRSVFDEWFQGQQRELLGTQQDDGAWPDRTYGAAYATAMSVLVLCMPDGLLPVYLR